jgi:hypothetical protein
MPSQKDPLSRSARGFDTNDPHYDEISSATFLDEDVDWHAISLFSEADMLLPLAPATSQQGPQQDQPQWEPGLTAVERSPEVLALPLQKPFTGHGIPSEPIPYMC